MTTDTHPHHTHDAEDMPNEYLGPSKTQRKRDADAMLTLGKQLVEIQTEKLRQLNIPTQIFDTIIQAKDIQAHAAKKRQFKFLARMLQSIDTHALEKWIEQRDQQHQQGIHSFHHIEQARDQLIQGGKAAMTSFVTTHPNVDHQKLNQLVRSANKEVQNQKPLKSARLLFRYLKEIMPLDSEHTPT